MTNQTEVMGTTLEIPMAEGFEAFAERVSGLEDYRGLPAIAARTDRLGLLQIMGGVVAPEVDGEACQLFVPAFETVALRAKYETNLFNIKESTDKVVSESTLDTYLDCEASYQSDTVGEKGSTLEKAMTGQVLDMAIGGQNIQRQLLHWGEQDFPGIVTTTAAASLWSRLSIHSTQEDIPRWTNAIEAERGKVIDTIVDIMCANGALKGVDALMSRSEAEDRLVVGSPQDSGIFSVRQSNGVGSNNEVEKLQRLGMDIDTIMRTLLHRMGVFF